MSSKPKALYYGCLKWQLANISYMKELFEVVTYATPSILNPAKDTEFDVVFWPQGYGLCYKKAKIQACNTTSDEHFDKLWCAEENIAIVILDSTSWDMHCVTPTPEHTWGLIHAIHRGITTRHDEVLSGVWDRRINPPSNMLSKMSIGVVGYGRVGQQVLRIADAYGLSSAFYDPYASGIHKKIDSLYLLASMVDILVITCALTDETKGMINEKILENMQCWSFLINTARAEIIDEVSLIEQLRNNKIRGAALDVISGEYGQEDKSKHPLVAYAKTHDNLILTPHIAGSTIDAWHMTERLIINKVSELLEWSGGSNPL